MIRQGHLAGFDMNAAIKRIRKRLERSKIHGRIVLGGLDVSLNVEANVITGWQFHIYLIVEGKNDAALQKAIKDALSWDKSEASNERWGNRPAACG